MIVMVMVEGWLELFGLGLVAGTPDGRGSALDLFG